MSTSRIWLNGNELSKKVISQVKQSILLELTNNPSFYHSHPKWSSPQLHIINVGYNAASLSYIRKKIDLASSIGIKFQLHQFADNFDNEQPLHSVFDSIVKSNHPDNFRLHNFQHNEPSKRFNKISKLIEQLNHRTEVNGILMQLPLQQQLKIFTNQIIDQISPIKDVDCLNIINRSRIIQHTSPQLIPCTPSGVLKILDQHNIDVTGKRVVIAGRSSLVGLPLFHLLLNRNATITLCHAHSLNLNSLTKQADIVISAVGKPNLITQLKPGGISIDIGISRDSNGKLCGDIQDSVKRTSSLSTPVPGGVGPMTVAMLMDNTVRLWKKQMRLQQNRHNNS